MDIVYEEEKSTSLIDYIKIAKRRSKPMLVTALVILFIAVLLAIFWPPTYRSTAVILIEEQDVPPDLVRSTITSYAVQRIEEIKQRIMTVGNIMSIIDQFKLYDEDELQRYTRSELAREFRSNVNIAPISADVIDPRSGRPTEAVIAFSLAFDGKTIDTVQKVTNELVTLYLNENARERTEQSTSTSEFLSNEAASLNSQLDQLGAEISSFKEKNQGSLPELHDFNLSVVERSRQDILNITTRLQELESRRIDLASRLSQLDPSAPTVLANGKAVLSDADRLKALQSEYRRKKAIYHSEHPDILRLEYEIKNLVASLGEVDQYKDLVEEVQVAQRQLSGAKQRYTKNHPEVLRLEKVVQDLEDKLQRTVASSEETTADNPAYVLLQTQLETVDSEKASLQKKKQALETKISEYESNILRAPEVEKDYQTLLRDYDNTRAKYREIKSKQMEAELAKNLETERKGERFTLIQPPELPEEPVKPNRILILIIGIVMAGGLGIGAAALSEALDGNIYGEQAIAAATGIAPMVLIPYMEDTQERRQKIRTIYALIIGAIVLTAIGIVLFHYFVKPLDVTWYILMRKLGLN